jgi:hypothetical protein
LQHLIQVIYIGKLVVHDPSSSSITCAL